MDSLRAAPIMTAIARRRIAGLARPSAGRRRQDSRPPEERRRSRCFDEAGPAVVPARPERALAPGAATWRCPCFDEAASRWPDARPPAPRQGVLRSTAPDGANRALALSFQCGVRTWRGAEMALCKGLRGGGPRPRASRPHGLSTGLSPASRTSRPHEPFATAPLGTRASRPQADRRSADRRSGAEGPRDDNAGGTPAFPGHLDSHLWIPASAGMTKEGGTPALPG